MVKRYSLILPAIITGLLLLMMVSKSVCSRSRGEESLQGQPNVEATLYGIAIDERGQPLPGAEFEYVVREFVGGSGFSSVTADRESVRSSVKTDSHGRFEISIRGHSLKIISMTKGGFRPFFDLRSSSGASLNNIFFRFVSWGKIRYESSTSSPAVYVFVGDGVREIQMLPSRGGRDWTSVQGVIIENKPGWPRKPSIDGVRLKEPTD